jgi:two-component system, LuxR family, sensor kinase FixL
MTIGWPMMIAACLTLALINLRIALGDVRRLPHVFFFFSALAVAAVSGLELAILRAGTVEEVNRWLRWSSIPLVVMVGCVTGFVWSFFRTGKSWLAIAGVGLLTCAEMANLLSEPLAVRHAIGLQKVQTFGGVLFTKPDVVEGPWSVVEIAGVLLVVAFVLDASRKLWKSGGQRRALIVGGSITFFFLASRGHAGLVERGLLHTPYFVSFAFLAVLIAMGHELSDEVFRAAQLSRDLLESERRMDLAAHSAKMGFWSWDPKLDEIWASESARELFEVPLTERIDLGRFLAAVHPADRDGVQKAVEAAWAGGMTYEREYRVPLSNGTERWIAARGRVELGAAGKPMLMRGVLLDITTEKRSEAELQQLRGQLAHAGRVSMMGQLASALAHELNQPLGAILRNAEAADIFMQAANPNLDEVRAIISDIRKDDQRAGEVIDRLRTLLKRRDIESSTLSVSQLLDEVLALIRADAAARGVKLTVQCKPDLPAVRGDRVHLQQVLINLIINAMDALSETSLPERKVVVGADVVKHGFVEVTVGDNGLGISPEKLPQVFDPFFTTKPHGMGMGLPISRTIIEAHGGRIAAENLAGGGTIFRFTLPEDASQES